MDTRTDTDAAPQPPDPPKQKVERPGPGYATARTWAFRVVGLTLLLAGGLHLQAASIQSTVAAPPPGYVQPGLWVDGSVSMVVLAFTLAIISWLTFRDLWRAVVPVITLVAALATGTFGLVTLMIEPGPLGGAGFRGPLTAIGFALVAIAAVFLLLGHRGRMRKARRWGIIGIAFAVVLGVTAVTFSTELWLPSASSAANTVSTVSTNPAPAARAAKLDGSLEWSAQVADRAGPWIPTAGGLVATTGRGLTMTDPRTGKQRWAQIRYDSKNVDNPRVSPDGKIVAIAGRRDESSNVLFNSPPMRWLWVFDAVTGEKLTDRQAPDEKSALIGAMAGDWLLWSSGPSQTARGTMTATRYDGTVLWQRKIPDSCVVRSAQSASDGRVLAMLGCRSNGGRGAHQTPSQLMMFSAETGGAYWRWAAPTSTQLSVGVLRPGVGEALVLQHRAGQPEYTLASVRLRDGAQLWLDASRRAPEPDWGGSSVAYRRNFLTSGGFAIVAETTADGRAIEFRAVRPDNGATAWTSRLETAGYERSTLRWNAIVLPDGRLLLGLTGSPEGTGGEAARDYKLRLVTLDATSGAVGGDTSIPLANDATVPADLDSTPMVRLHASDHGIMTELLKGEVPFFGASIG